MEVILCLFLPWKKILEVFHYLVYMSHIFNHKGKLFIDWSICLCLIRRLWIIFNGMIFQIFIQLIYNKRCRGSYSSGIYFDFILNYLLEFELWGLVRINSTAIFSLGLCLFQVLGIECIKGISCCVSPFWWRW